MSPTWICSRAANQIGTCNFLDASRTCLWLHNILFLRFPKVTQLSPPYRSTWTKVSPSVLGTCHYTNVCTENSFLIFFIVQCILLNPNYYRKKVLNYCLSYQNIKLYLVHMWVKDFLETKYKIELNYKYEINILKIYVN